MVGAGEFVGIVGSAGIPFVVAVVAIEVVALESRMAVVKVGIVHNSLLFDVKVVSGYIAAVDQNIGS